MRVSKRECGGLQRKNGIFNEENQGDSNENLGSPMKIWGFSMKICDLLLNLLGV